MSQPAKYPEHPDLAPRVDGIEPFHVMALLGEARELERQGDIHYTSSLGLASLRETIAGYYQQRFNVDIPADPTGTMVSAYEMVRISKLVKARGGYLIVDEIYHGLVYDSST